MQKLLQLTLISLEEYSELQSKLGAKDERKHHWRWKKTYLEETLEELMMYDTIFGQVPTQNVQNLIENVAKRAGENFKDIPHRTTVEQMTRELGIIADLQTSEMAMKVTN